MAVSGAQPGNTNSKRGAEWRTAIRYALAKVGRERDPDGEDPAYKRGLRLVAEKFIEAAEAGEAWALKELGDRTDGKASQVMEITGADGGPIDSRWTIEIVESKRRNSEEKE